MITRLAPVAAGGLALVLLSGCTSPVGSVTLGGASTSTKSASKTTKDTTKDDKNKDDNNKDAKSGNAEKALAKITIKGRAPKTGYARTEFGTAWKDVDHNGCDTRDDILRRDLKDVKIRAKTHGCVVIAGTLEDHYTGTTIVFAKASASKVQIDHVVALENAWVTGAAKWTETKRTELANDPLNLLAVDGPTNASKGAGDAATWLPRKSYRCSYVARQVAVKQKYDIWMTRAEHDSIKRILDRCPDQALPTEGKAIPLGAS